MGEPSFLFLGSKPCLLSSFVENMTDSMVSVVAVSSAGANSGMIAGLVEDPAARAALSVLVEEEDAEAVADGWPHGVRVPSQREGLGAAGGPGACSWDLLQIEGDPVSLRAVSEKYVQGIVSAEATEVFMRVGGPAKDHETWSSQT